MDPTGAWSVGHQMTQEEGDAFIEVVEWKEVISATTQPTPGGHFSDPYQGNSLMRTTDNSLFSWSPNIDQNFENDAPVFLGKLTDDRGLIEIAASFIVNGDHEVSTAIAFHYKPNDFASWPGFFVQALPELYWCRCTYSKNDFQKNLDLELKATSPLYKRLAEFFDDPNDPKCLELKSDLLSSESFQDLYFGPLKYGKQ